MKILTQLLGFFCSHMAGILAYGNVIESILEWCGQVLWGRSEELECCTKGREKKIILIREYY